MNRARKIERLNSLVWEFLNELGEDKDAFILKKIRASKEFKEYAKDKGVKVQTFFDFYDFDDPSFWRQCGQPPVETEPSLPFFADC